MLPGTDHQTFIEPTYSRSVFEAILKGLGEENPYTSEFLCDERGVHIKDVSREGPLAWHPLCELMKPGSPNPLDEPWLPFPFSARQLAALMVDGWGHFIQQKYGEWENGPDEEELASLGVLDGKAREALTAAYAAYRHAASVAPKLDRERRLKSDELARQYRTGREAAIQREQLREVGISTTEYSERLARVNVAVKDLGEQLLAARNSADREHASWRKAVVQHLLSDDPLAREASHRLASCAIPPTRPGPGAQPSNVGAIEDDKQRQRRRLRDLRGFGGDLVKKNGEWKSKERQSGAFRKLVEQEERNGVRPCSDKSVRNDLRAAAADEADEKRSGRALGGLGHA